MLKTPSLPNICLIIAAVSVCGCPAGTHSDELADIDSNTITDSDNQDSTMISASEAKEIAYQHAKERYSEACSSTLNDQINMGWRTRISR